MKQAIVIIGAGYDAILAALAAKEAHSHALVTVIEVSSLLSLDINTSLLCLNNHNMDITHDRRNLSFINDIIYINNAKILSIDLDAQIIYLEHINNTRCYFDKLIYAADIATTPIIVDNNIISYGFYLYIEINQLKSALMAKNNIVIYGYNFRSISLAEALIKTGVQVTIIDHHLSLANFSFYYNQMMKNTILNHDIKLIKSVDAINVIKIGQEKWQINTASNDAIITDLIISCMYAPRLCNNIEVSLDSHHHIMVNEYLQTSLPHVYAFGPALRLAKTSWFLPHDNIITAMAILSGHNAALDEHSLLKSSHMLNHTLSFNMAQSYWARSGLLDYEASIKFGHDETIALSSYDKNINIRTIIHKKSQLIVGAEVYGDHDSKRIINIMAMAITNNLTLTTLLDMDILLDYHDPLAQLLRYSHKVLAENMAIVSADIVALWHSQNKAFTIVDLDDSPTPINIITSIHMPFKELGESLAHLGPKDKVIILCSRSLMLGYLAQKVLTKSGFLAVFQLDGGMDAFNHIM